MDDPNRRDHGFQQSCRASRPRQIKRTKNIDSGARLYRKNSERLRDFLPSTLCRPRRRYSGTRLQNPQTRWIFLFHDKKLNLWPSPPRWPAVKSQPPGSVMTPHQHILSFVDTSREICRSSVIGMQFFHQGPVRANDFLLRSALLKSQDFIRFLFGHHTKATLRLSSPRVVFVLRCRTPAGKPAVKIGFHQPRAVGIIQAAKVEKIDALRPGH